MGNRRSSTTSPRFGRFGRFGWGVLALGLLAGCPTVDLGDTPADIGLCNPTQGAQYFQDQIWPNFIVRNNVTSSCIRAGGGCHDQTGGNALSFQTAPIDFKTNYRAAQVYLNCGTPMMSELLTKPLQGIDDPHGGGNIFVDASDPAVKVFLDWFK